MSDPRDGEPGHPITAEHVQALGRITLEYSRLEWMLSAFIWELVARDQRIGQTITAGLMLSSRIELLRALFGVLPSYGVAADVAGLAAVLKQVDAAARKRNALVHALVWIPDGAGGFKTSKLQRGKAAEWVDSPADVGTLAALADELRAAWEGLSQFQIAHFKPFEQLPSANPMMPHGSLYGPSVQAAIQWFIQFDLLQVEGFDSLPRRRSPRQRSKGRNPDSRLHR